MLDTFAELLSYDAATGEIRWRVDRANQHAGTIAGNVGPNGYRTICVNYRSYYAHHLAIILSGRPAPPRGSHVDHINGDRADNRIGNLRVVTPSHNGLNRHRLNRNNTSGFRGVRFDPSRRRWVAQIMVGRKVRHLGRFKTIEEAQVARERAYVTFSCG